MSRWIKLYDDVLNWRWAHKPEYVSFMVHCLLMANPQPKKWENIEIPRGSFITSVRNFAKVVGISEKQYRTILNNLEGCEFLKTERTHQFTMITICNYESYQAVKNKKDTAETQQGHTTDTAEAQQGHTTDTAEAHTIEYIDNREKENEEIKDSFLKNGKAAEKKVFKIEEIKAALAAEGIYMTENGYVEFKALNEGENGYGYKGGIIRSAQNFLQKPMNQKYSLARENNGNGKGKGKNTPPTPPQPPQAAPISPEAQKKAEEIWGQAAEIIREQMSIKDFNTWIKPIKPLNIEGQELTIQVPSSFFYEYIEENLIGIFTQVLNKQNINKLQYRVKV